MNAFQRVLGGAALAVLLTSGLAAPTMAQDVNKKNPVPPASTSAGIDFGDDTSDWARDGECDDPRFTGTGSAAETVDEDRLRDATDCRAAYEAGTVTLKDGISPDDIAIVSPINAIDFGDDTGEWTRDGECDDPRFQGAGMAAELVDADIRKDASDCRAAYAAGTVTLKDVGGTTVVAVDFGDDTGEWANDGECDDPRFQGAGMAAELVDADIRKDAADCEAAFNAGTVTLVGGDAPAAAIDYGDDTSQWANDGECDDPRFSGSGVARELVDADLGHDAADCRAAVEAGTATFNGDSQRKAAIDEFDYGSDWSKWANDGECDDLRFMGEGTDKKLLTDDLYGDATDCRTLEAEGRVTIRKVYSPQYAAGAPYDSSHVDFGDNTSSYANDDRCDDPRFEGPGAAAVLLESDERHDSVDCKAAYEAGQILLITEGEEGN